MSREDAIAFALSFVTTHPWQSVVVVSVLLVALAWILISTIKGVVEVLRAPFDLVGGVLTGMFRAGMVVLRGYPTKKVDCGDKPCEMPDCHVKTQG